MALGTIFTLLVIPSIYVLLAKEHAGEDIGKLVIETPSEGEDMEPALAK
jgi:hypothetical protein